MDLGNKEWSTNHDLLVWEKKACELKAGTKQQKEKVQVARSPDLPWRSTMGVVMNRLIWYVYVRKNDDRYTKGLTFLCMGSWNLHYHLFAVLSTQHKNSFVLFILCSRLLIISCVLCIHRSPPARTRVCTCNSHSGSIHPQLLRSNISCLKQWTILISWLFGR